MWVAVAAICVNEVAMWGALLRSNSGVSHAFVPLACPSFFHPDLEPWRGRAALVHGGLRR